MVKNRWGHLFSLGRPVPVIWCILKIIYDLSWLFSVLTMMQWFLVETTLYSTCLTFKCQSTAVLFTALALVRRPAVVGRILWNKVCLSFCLPICPGVFLEFDLSISLIFGMVLVVCDSWDYWEKTLFLKRNRIGFFKFKEKFGH